MNDQKINHLACWASIILIDAFLYIWYNVIFYNQWLENNNLSAEEFVANRSFVPYAISLLSTVIIVYLIAWIFKGLNVDDFQSGVGIGLSIAFALTFLNVLGRDMYLFRPIEISLIDGGASLFACMIAGGILGAWTGNTETTT